MLCNGDLAYETGSNGIQKYFDRLQDQNAVNEVSWTFNDIFQTFEHSRSCRPFSWHQWKLNKLFATSKFCIGCYMTSDNSKSVLHLPRSVLNVLTPVIFKQAFCTFSILYQVLYDFSDNARSFLHLEYSVAGATRILRHIFLIVIVF